MIGPRPLVACGVLAMRRTATSDYFEDPGTRRQPNPKFPPLSSALAHLLSDSPPATIHCHASRRWLGAVPRRDDQRGGHRPVALLLGNPYGPGDSGTRPDSACWGLVV